MKTTTVNAVDAIELQGMCLLTGAELDEVSGGRHWYSGIVDGWHSIIHGGINIKITIPTSPGGSPAPSWPSWPESWPSW